MPSFKDLPTELIELILIQLFPSIHQDPQRVPKDLRPLRLVSRQFDSSIRSASILWSPEHILSAPRVLYNRFGKSRIEKITIGLFYNYTIDKLQVHPRQLWSSIPIQMWLSAIPKRDRKQLQGLTIDLTPAPYWMMKGKRCSHWRGTFLNDSCAKVFPYTQHLTIFNLIRRLVNHFGQGCPNLQLKLFCEHGEYPLREISILGMCLQMISIPGSVQFLVIQPNHLNSIPVAVEMLMTPADNEYLRFVQHYVMVIAWQNDTLIAFSQFVTLDSTRAYNTLLWLVNYIYKAAICAPSSRAPGWNTQQDYSGLNMVRLLARDIDIQPDPQMSQFQRQRFTLLREQMEFYTNREPKTMLARPHPVSTMSDVTEAPYVKPVVISTTTDATEVARDLKDSTLGRLAEKLTPMDSVFW